MKERINWIDWAKALAVKPYAALIFPIINLLFMHYSFVLKGLYNGEMHAFMPIVNLFSIVLDVAVVFLFFLCLTKGKKNLSVHLTFILTLIWSFQIYYIADFSISAWVFLPWIKQAMYLTDWLLKVFLQVSSGQIVSLFYGRLYTLSSL